MVAEVKQLNIRQCQDCPAVIEMRYGRYCSPCRSKRRRKNTIYESNDFIDQQIRRIYHQRCEKRMSGIPGLKEVAAKVGWPTWALKNRARKLGLTRTKDTTWSEAELQILQRFAWMSPERIKDKLKAAGFNRTATAITLKSKRTAAKQNTPYYSGRGLAGCFGVDSHAVTRWIRMSWLKARMRGTERTDAQGGDAYLIHENDVRAFILSHPMQFDIRKVDQLWFLNLITEGRICQ